MFRRLVSFVLARRPHLAAFVAYRQAQRTVVMESRGHYGRIRNLLRSAFPIIASGRDHRRNLRHRRREALAAVFAPQTAVAAG